MGARQSLEELDARLRPAARQCAAVLGCTTELDVGAMCRKGDLRLGFRTEGKLLASEGVLFEIDCARGPHPSIMLVYFVASALPFARLAVEGVIERAAMVNLYDYQSQVRQRDHVTTLPKAILIGTMKEEAVSLHRVEEEFQRLRGSLWTDMAARFRRFEAQVLALGRRLE